MVSIEQDRFRKLIRESDKEDRRWLEEVYKDSLLGDRLEQERAWQPLCPDYPDEVTEILRRVGDRIQRGERSFSIIDTYGNRVGHCQVR